jgi:hypothetical protein
MQEDCIQKKEDKVPNREHKCFKNYTYEGFVNKKKKKKNCSRRREKKKKRQKKKRKKKKRRHHVSASNISSSLSCRSTIIIITIILGGIRISLGTSTAAPWRLGKAVLR